MFKITGPKIIVELPRAHGIEHSPWFTKHLLGSLDQTSLAVGTKFNVYHY